MGENKTIINLCTQQEYKYSKHNNRFGKPILLYNASSKGSHNYMSLVSEILNQHG